MNTQFQSVLAAWVKALAQAGASAATRHHGSPKQASRFVVKESRSCQWTGAFCTQKLQPYWINTLKNSTHTLKPGSRANLEGFMSVILRLKGFYLKPSCTHSASKQSRDTPLPGQTARQCWRLTGTVQTPRLHSVPQTVPVRRGHRGLPGAEPGGMWAALLEASPKAAPPGDAQRGKGWCREPRGRASSLRGEVKRKMEGDLPSSKK